MEVGEWAKLRSVARVEDVDGEKTIVKNNFTSLIKIHDWMFDAQNANINADKGAEEDDCGLYTDLATLQSAPVASIANKTFWVKA